MNQVKRIYGKLKSTGILSNFLNLGSIQVSNMLLALLSMVIVTRTVGIVAFGLVTSGYRFALLAGSGINYGTGQSGIRDTALTQGNAVKLSNVFYTTLLLRLIIFLIFLVAIFILQVTGLFYSKFVWFSMPVVLAEVFNPLCFYIGVEKLKTFNIYNLISNVAALGAIIFMVHGADDALFVNFILGMANIATYGVLLMQFAIRFKLPLIWPHRDGLKKLATDNFYLTINNASANLQQNVIIFVLTKWSTPNILGAYAVCDRFIGQIRNILNIVANAIYPNAVRIYVESLELWNNYRRKIKRLFMALFFAGGLITFVLADLIIDILSDRPDVTAILFLRIMAFVPVISVLNTINTLDQLIKKHNVYIFRIATLLLVISTLLAVVLTTTGNVFLIGAFTVIVEICGCLMYEYVITKPSVQHD